MKQVLLIAVLVLVYSFKASTERLALRNLFYDASENSDSSEVLFEKMKLVDDQKRMTRRNDCRPPCAHDGFGGAAHGCPSLHALSRIPWEVRLPRIQARAIDVLRLVLQLHISKQPHTARGNEKCPTQCHRS